MRHPLSLLLCLLPPALSWGQLIWADPAFPTPSQGVTVFFDATKGTAGLANCNCDVYLHTGLITSKSTSSGDWKYVVTTWGVANANWKMTPVPGQLNQFSYVIGPSIAAYYGVSDPNEVIEKLAFVFRNTDGSKEGKDVGGADIFYNVYPDNPTFNVTLITPSEPVLFTNLGAQIPVQGEANDEATLGLFDNGVLVYSTFGKTLSFTLTAQAGAHEIRFAGERNDTAFDSKTFTYVVPEPNAIEPLPPGIEPGITFHADTAITLALYAPGKEHVYAIGDFNEWKVLTDYQMRLTPDGSTWWLHVGGLEPGSYYAFQYLVDGVIRIGDPYSPLVLDPGHDNAISEAVFPGLPPYPVGKTTGIATLIQVGEPAYNWQVNNFLPPPKDNLVIYEMLLSDFLSEHNYQTLAQRLDYLADLGVKAIELMPVSEFDGNISWGYNPTYHYALDKYYGTPEAFKALVDACHQRGIAVILDVVFNHAHGRSPLAMLYWNGAANKPAADNPWLNQDPTHDFSVFNDFNHESTATKFYVKKTLQHWLEEYRVDGFRFDLSKGFTQNVNGPWHAGNYDASRIAILKDYADAIWLINPGAHVILEHFTDWNEEKELVDYGALSWAGFDVHNQYLEAAMGYSSNLSGASYLHRGWSVPGLMAYMESHDEERMMYKNLQYGNSSGDYNVKALPTALERVALASAFFYTIPGPKMLWQFGELGYDFSINTCTNGTVNPNCRLDPKPIRWDYAYQPDRVQLYNSIRQLLHLRNQYDLFRSADFQLDVSGFQKSVFLNSDTMNAAVFGNFAVGEANISPAFQHSGWWYEYFSGDSLDVGTTPPLITLAPGEYRLYTDARLSPPPFVTNAEQGSAFAAQWEVYPNPAFDGTFTLNLKLPRATPALAYLLDIAGRRTAILFSETLPAGETTLDVQLPLPAGLYFIALEVNGSRQVKKLIIY